MLPSTIVGSLVVDRAPQPFALDVASGKVSVGRAVEADPHQAQMSAEERGAAERQVRAQVPKASEIRLGAYRCPICKKWIDVVRHPDRWAGDRCARCG
jgi:hypothetical protein